MAKARKRTGRRASRPAVHNSRRRRAVASNPRHRRRSNPTRTRVVMMKPNRHRRARRNPQFMGSNVKPMKMVELVAGGLVGLGTNNLVLSMLPSTLTSNSFGAILSSIGVALASGYAGSFVDKEFGVAVAFGGLMASGQLAINTFAPSIGSSIGLSGVRGTGDFVGGSFTVPQTPVTLTSGGQTGGGIMAGAYPMAYST